MISIFFLLLTSQAYAAGPTECRVTEIVDPSIFENYVNTTDRSAMKITTTRVGYRIFIGKLTYENWEYCNVEETKVGYRIDDYKEDIVLFLNLKNARARNHSRSLKSAGTITVQLNRAKPATPVAKIECR